MASRLERLNSRGSISSHYTHQLITAHRGVMLTAGPWPLSEAHPLIVWRWRSTTVQDYSLMNY